MTPNSIYPEPLTPLEAGLGLANGLGCLDAWRELLEDLDRSAPWIGIDAGLLDTAGLRLSQLIEANRSLLVAVEDKVHLDELRRHIARDDAARGAGPPEGTGWR